MKIPIEQKWNYWIDILVAFINVRVKLEKKGYQFNFDVSSIVKLFNQNISILNQTYKIEFILTYVFEILFFEYKLLI